jgi:hypothetical protein
MKKLLFISLFVLFIGSSTGYSQDITWTPIPIPGSSQSQEDDYKPYRQKQPTYKSSTGTQYQYDLNNPADRVNHNADPAAQLRDRLNTNPKVKIDQSVGQYGGGVKQE